MTLISGFYPILPLKKEFSGNIIVQHLGSKMSISSNWASKRVVIGTLQRGGWMEAVPTVPCYQAASCPMLLWGFPRKLVKAICGETKTVKSVHGRPGTSVFVEGMVGTASIHRPLCNALNMTRWLAQFEEINILLPRCCTIIFPEISFLEGRTG